jgi:hypothetical protein
MDVSVVHVSEAELSGTCAEVALLVPVALQIPVDGAHHGEAPDIKLSILVQQGLLNILLNDVTAFVATGVVNKAFDLVEILAHGDATASVGILSRFDYPEVLAKFWVLVQDGLFS